MKRLAVAIAAGALAGCATLPPPIAPTATLALADTPFSIGGRISARRGTDGVAGSFAW